MYVSRNDQEWEDKGTGRFTFEFLTQADKMGIIILSEDSDESLLIHAIGTGTDYSIEDDSKIITWTEGSQSDDSIALSFQDDNFCKKSFKTLQRILSKKPKPSQSTPEEGPKSELPDLTLKTLESVVKVFEEVQPFTREQLLTGVRNSAFISQLIDVFQQCEDLEDIGGCENCCRIARSLVLHSDPTLAETLFSEDCALHIIGALEYDPDSSVRIKHRQFLKEQVLFKEVVPIRDSEIIRQIHLIYRMQYVKDVILPRLLDETVFNCLSHIIMMNHIEVVASLSTQPCFFQELFSLIQEKETNSEEWKDLVSFLQDYCLLVRQLQPLQQQGILLKLHKLGLFSTLTDVLKEGYSETKLKAIDILNSSLRHDASALRTHICQTNNHPILQLLVENLIHGDELNLTDHSFEVIRQLMDPSVEDSANRFNTLQDIFYNDCVPQMVDALSLEQVVSPRARGSILELLCFCVPNHGYNIKYTLLRGNIINQVLALFKAKERWLVVSAVRFIRILIGMKDEFFDRMIQRNSILSHLIDLLLDNGERNNLLNSTLLELFDFLRKEKRHVHISEIITNHFDKIKDIDYVFTFQGLKLEFDKSQEVIDESSQPSPPIEGRMKRDSRAMEKEEEDYFAEGSDDNERILDTSPTGKTPHFLTLLILVPEPSTSQSSNSELMPVEGERLDIESPQDPTESPRLKRLRASTSGNQRE